MCKVPLNAPIVDFDGETHLREQDGRTLTSGSILLNLARISFSNDSERDKIRLAEIGIKIADAMKKGEKEVDLCDDDLSLLYQRAVVALIPIVLYRLREILYRDT